MLVAIVVLIMGSVNFGFLQFAQENPQGPVTITGEIKGLTPGRHGFHVHVYGDIRNDCANAGPHFNPEEKTHGGPDDYTRHVADLGNLEADAYGVAKVDFKDSIIQLDGPNSIIGRALVVHADPDDLGKGGNKDSLETGNSGARVACGVIGLAPPAKPTYPPKEEYGPPKEEYGPPKEEYGPPKEEYGPPKEEYYPPKPTSYKEYQKRK